MNQEASLAVKTKPRRRWFQFSLLSLMIFLFVLGAALAVWRASPGERQRRAVQNLRQAGGFVEYTNNLDVVHSRTDLLLRKWLPRDYFDKVIGVTFFTCSDDDLAPLPEFTDLLGLSLRGTQVTDAGLKNLKGLKQLNRLNLSGTGVTDAGLRELPELSGLRVLELEKTQISNEGIVHLKKMSELQLLNLTLTNCTGNGADDLQKSLPKCRIILPWMDR